MRRLDPAMECWRQPIKGDCCLLCSQTPPTVVVWGILERRGAQGLPSCPSSDISTPLGLSRQHLSYLQEIGSGWFGKVRGLGGRQRGIHTSQACAPVLCLPALPSALGLPSPHAPQPAPLPPPLTHSHPPTPTSVGQRLPPHSIDHSASPPGSPRVRQSVHPSIRPRVHRTLGL